MTNRIAITLFVLILGIFIADHLFLQQNLAVQAGRMMDGAIEYLSFWR